MALSIRFYLFEEGGTLKRVSRRVCEGLTFGTDAIPEYAGTRQRAAEVIVENENGKPVRILDASGLYWIFDERGRIDAGLRAAAVWTLDFGLGSAKDSTSKVVDLRPELKRRQWNKENRWDLTAEDLNRIAADLWPRLANAEEIQTVKGKAPKKPPLTHDARHALGEIQTKVAAISHLLTDLSEPALKGLAYEAVQNSKVGLDDNHIWNAVALEADKHREIKARHRTGRGTFFAILHVWFKEEPQAFREIDTVEVRCNGKQAAIEVARRLLAEKAHLFSEDVSVEVEVLTELEWAPSDGEGIKIELPQSSGG